MASSTAGAATVSPSSTSGSGTTTPAAPAAARHLEEYHRLSLLLNRHINDLGPAANSAVTLSRTLVEADLAFAEAEGQVRRCGHVCGTERRLIGVPTMTRTVTPTDQGAGGGAQGDGRGGQAQFPGQGAVRFDFD